MYTKVHQCRACGYGRKPTPSGVKSGDSNEKLELVFSLGVQPLANDFCAEDDEHAGWAPLEVLFCPRCSLAQLSVVVRPSLLYNHYAYVTSPSETMAAHFSKLYTDLKARCNPMQRILEIGSNDGRFLKFLMDAGHDVCGIDPAENLVPEGIDSVCDVLSPCSANEAKETLGGPADLVIARHVFCHVDDWLGFFQSVREMTHTDSLIAIEVPYVGNLLSRTEFDTIYHEHLSYLSYKALLGLLARTMYDLHDILDYDIHGGAVLLLIRHKASTAAPNSVAVQKAKAENITVEHWHQFSARAHNLTGELHDLIKGLVGSKKRICAYGASAKSTVLLRSCRLTNREISFICDNTKWKCYKHSPGSSIPIYDEGALLREMPDYALLTAWNFSPEILAKNQLYASKGGKFIIPVPEVKIVP